MINLTEPAAFIGLSLLSHALQFSSGCDDSPAMLVLGRFELQLGFLSQMLGIGQLPAGPLAGAAPGLIRWPGPVRPGVLQGSTATPPFRRLPRLSQNQHPGELPELAFAVRRSHQPTRSGLTL